MRFFPTSDATSSLPLHLPVRFRSDHGVTGKKPNYFLFADYAGSIWPSAGHVGLDCHWVKWLVHDTPIFYAWRQA